MDAPISFHFIPRVVAPRRMKLASRRSALIAQSRAVLSLLLVWILVGQTVAPNLWRVQGKSVVTSSSLASLRARSEKSSWVTRAFAYLLPNVLSTPLDSPTNTLIDAVISRRRPDIRSGRIEGTLRVLESESFAIGGNTQITGDLFLPSAPSIQLNGGAQHGGVVNEGGAATSNYALTLSGGLVLPGRIHTHVDPVSLPANFPASVPAATGLRSITLRAQSDVASIGDWTTIRDLNITRAGLTVDVPPGNYGTFTVNGNSRLNFTGGTYNFANTFNLDGGATLQATGLVTINVGQNLTINSGGLVLGSYTAPGDVHLNVLGPLLTINGSSQVSSLVRADRGTVTLNGTSQIRGQVIANSFTLNGGRVIGAVWPARTAEGLAIVGPRRFDRTAGQSNQYLEQFALPAGVTSPFSLHIQNGSLDGSNRVSSAIVKINGTEVSIQNDLNQNVASIDRTVTLGINNTLEVRLSSSPGSYLIIGIQGLQPETDTTSPSIVITAPVNNTTTTDSELDITGTASDSGSPATGVAHVYVNGIEATFNQTDSTWALQDVPLAMGTNEITVRAVDAAGNEKTTTISITREAPNHGPVVNAGADQTFALPQTASLHGAASDDGLPSGSSLSTNWSVVSNPGSVAFSSVESLETTAAFGSPGTYVLRLTASDGELSNSDDITLTVQPENQPPTVSAGPNQTIALPRTATLNGTVTDDGLPEDSIVNTLWLQISGPGTTTFEDPLLVETAASFSAPGIYVLRLTATDGELNASNEVTITVHPENQAPTADAGADQIISLPASAQLNGAASDDGWPAGSTLSVGWSSVSGPGTVAFANPNVTMTVASFSAPGTYVLRLTATDGELSASDELVVTVTPPNQAPEVNAGTNQTITLPAAADLNGIVTDDGLPLGSSVSAHWSRVTGPGDVSFDNAGQLITAARFSAPGEYVLRLTATDGALTSSADVFITVIPENHSPTASAGADQAITLPNTASLNGGVSDDGLPAGSTVTTTWQKLSGPGEVTFASPNTTVTTAAFSAPGLYTLQLTASDSELIGADEVEITVTDPRVAPNADFVVPESTGTASSFLIASSGSTSSAFSADKILDNDITTRWTASGITNQFATMQFLDQESVFIDRVRLQGLNGAPGTATVKDFEVQVSATDANDSSFVTVLTALLLNTGQLQEFVFPGGPARARFIKFLPKNNYGSSTNIQVATFTPVAVGSADSLISLPGQANSALDQSPALLANGAAVYRYSYSEGDAAPNSLLSYNGRWSPSAASNPFVIIQLAGGKLYTIDGVKMATTHDLGSTANAAVEDFEVWASATAADDASFSKVLSATALSTGRLQTFIFPGGPVQARYIKYVPLTNGGGSTINTQSFDVIAQNAAQVVSASSQSQTGLSPAEAAFDSDTQSSWFSQSNTVTNVWVKTALADGATQKVYGVRVLPVNDFSLGQRGPKDFDIRVSTTTTDDAAFTTVFSGTLSGTINGGIQEVLFTNLVDAKYVQFFWKNGYGASNIGVRSLEVLAVPRRGCAIVAFSSQQDPPTNALDLDPTNQWVTALNQPTNQWLKLVLPDASRLWTINHFALRASILGGSWSAPKDFEFQVSTTDANDSSFTTAFAGTLANSTQLQDFYFPAAQARYVRLLIKNNYGNGRLGLASFYIYAANQIGSTTRFMDRSTDADGSIVNWAWSFGDGTTSNEQHPSHTFAQPGDYVVSLTVTDSSGLTNTRQVVYQVVESLHPEFSFSPVIAHEGGEAVRFTDTTRLLSDPNTTRRYDFGDGGTLTTSNGVSSHRYDDSGIFPATLKIGDQLGVVHTTTKDITVLNMAPTVDIDPGKIIVWGEPWTSVPRINDQSPIDRLTLQGQWHFDDGQTSTCVNCTNANATVTHAYSSPGTYTAVLTISDKDGGVEFDSAVFTVNKRPIRLAFQNTPAAEVGQPALLRVTLTDSFANQPLAGRTIEFDLNGAAASAITDANGYAEVPVTFAAGFGSNVATATVAEEEFYLAGSTYRVLQGVVNQQTCTRSSTGTDFWLMFPGNYVSEGVGAQEGTFLEISSEIDTIGTVTIPGQNFTQNFTVAAHSTTQVRVNHYHHNSDQIEARGIHVVSQRPVTVYGLYKIDSTIDAFLGLPTASLGNSYITLGYNNGGAIEGTQFGIVATANATSVTITPSVTVGSRAAGVPYNITLNQGQTYMLRDEAGANSDLSGTTILADKPIAAFGGHQCANIPTAFTYCDYVVEQLPPTDTWGRHFATVPLATRTKGDTFRFLAATDNTHVFLNSSRVATLNRGQHFEKIIEGPAEIASDHPILVAQYANSHNYDNQLGDPFMMLIPPLEHYLNSYTVTSLATFNPNLINVVAPTSDIGAVIFDGTPIDASAFVPIGNTGASGAQLTVSAGTHTLSGPHPFGVYVYGFALDVSYGYPGSLCLSSVLGPTTLTLVPKSQNTSIGKQSCVTATVKDQNGTPVNNQTVSFTIAGAHSQTPPTVMTNELGEAQLCYSATTPGDDLITATSGNSSDSASVSWRPPNQAPVVNAGTDETITLPAVANLSGTVADDGLPGNTLNLLWSKVSGPGNVIFSNAFSTTTTAVFDVSGVYVLRLAASDTELSSADELEITVNPAPLNAPPTANAGPDVSATINSNLIVNGGNDQPLVNGEISGWTEVQGTGWTLGTADADAPVPQRGQAYFFAGEDAQAELRQDIDVSSFAAGIASGTQQFEFKAYVRSAAEAVPDGARVIVEYRDAANTNVIATLDSSLIASTTSWHLTEVTRSAPVGTGWLRVRLIATRNTGVSNDAFFDSLSLRPVGNAAIKLGGVVTDDGLPFGSTLSSVWTILDGPGVVTFANAYAPVSSASFVTAGIYVLRLTSSDGDSSASDDVTVVVNPANQAPVVNAGVNKTITLPGPAALIGTVTDDGQPPGSSVSVAWSKIIGPGIVTFVDPNSVVTNASFSTAGVYVLRLNADDSEYSASSEVTITVNPAPNNQPPSVSAGPDQTISLPVDMVILNGAAADDGLPIGNAFTVGWTTISGPGSVTFGITDTAVTTAQFSATGTYVLRLYASDGAYLVTDDVTVILTQPNQSPTANAGTDQTILLSQQAYLNGSVADDGLPFGNTLTTTWSKVSGPGDVAFANANVTVTSATFGTTGTYVLRLTASDGQLSATDDITITVNDNVAPPTVAITSPADGAELTEPTLTTGSVSNGEWVLEYSLNSADGAANQLWIQAASGTAPVTNGSLGTLDTTLMLNGIYSLRLRATDSYGQISFTSIAVVVEKNFKVGHFQVAFSDLNVPVAGLPIEVIRSYDSRDKRTGDFGVGWTLGLKNARVEKTGVLGLSWFQTVSSGIIPTYCLEPSRPHKVAITFGDGKVFKFLASTSIHCQQFAPVTSTLLTFTPEPGTHAALEIVGPNDVLVESGGSLPGPVRLLSQSNPDIFNSSTFRLTTAEGAVFVIDQTMGVRSVRDPYGNTLAINSGGIIHSSGRSIVFTRDAEGRITQITDPNGNAQSYDYDANGDLRSFTDRELNTTTFTYNADHHLLSITDARGVELLQNQFDASGRLIGQTDAFNASLTYDHDVGGRVETITDRLGHQTRYEYDERGNVLRQVDAKGGIRTFTYDAFDNVLTETNALGKTTTYTYDAADNRTSITDPLGKVTRFTYNAARQPLTVTDALGHVTTNTYDAAGTNLLTTTDPLGKTTTYTYSVFTGQRTTMKDALNKVTLYDYDSEGRLSKETDALGHVTSFGYDANGNRTTQTVTRTNAQNQPETITTTYVHDKLNRLTKTIYADDSSTVVEYNAIGQQAATIDQLGHRTEFTYDEMGRLARTDYPDGTREETTYDLEGRRLTSKDRSGRVTSFTYDELGRLTKTTYPDGTFTSTTYDSAGQVLTVTDVRGNVTRYEYDDAGRRTKVRNALNQETSFVFDSNGNQLSITDALGHTTTHEYDANNRRTKTTYADATFDGVSYDALGRSVSRTDQAGKTTQFIYDAVGRLIKVKDALNQETTYSYNELGQQVSQTDANNHTTRFEFDQMGRRTKRILPLGQFETYAYDASGNLASRTDFNGKTTTFTHDVMRRLLSKAPDASLNQPVISFTYHVDGQRKTMTDISGVTGYSYDLRSRLASKQTPFGTLNYTYDGAGNLLTTRSSNANGTSLDYTYDVLNRLAATKDNNLAALNGGVTTYSYDTVGNLESYIYPNTVRTSYNYNSLNRLTSMNTNTAVTTLASYTYTLGAAGNRTAVTELSGRTTNYTYDELYRLTSETIANDPHGVNGTADYGYDPVGNRLSRNSSIAGVPSQTSAYDSNDRLTSDTYDDNGNTISSSGKNYDYDFENRLVSLSTQHSALSTFVYDGDGNRVGKTAGGLTTNYLVDTNNHTGYAQVVEELQGGAVTKQFTYGHDLISQRCTLPTANCSLSFYDYDGHGSVRLLTDATAAVTDTYDYDAFGNLISRTGTTDNNYLYSGEQFDANLGFYYLRARYMNPSSGRFWSMDSFEGDTSDPRSLHKFTYANNSPADVVDPSGHIGVGSIIGEINAVTWRVTLKAYEFPRAIAAGRLVLAALNVASFFGDNESRDLFITMSGGPLGAGLVLSESAAVLFNASKSALSAGFATTHGLSKTVVISEARANEFIMKKVGLTFEESSSFVASFDGPVSATIAEPGEQWLRYTGAAGSKGSFLTRVSFGNPQEAVDSLNLRPWGNPATLRQTVTATGRSIILEGRIKGSVPPYVKQTLIVDRERFQFTSGETY